MKQSSLALTIALLALPAVSRGEIQAEVAPLDVQLRQDAASLTLAVDLSRLEPRPLPRNGEEFSAYSIPGEGVTMTRGRPMLPSVSRFVVVPSDAGLELDISLAEPRRIRPEHPVALFDDPDYAPAALDNAPLFPAVPAEMSAPQVIRGVRLVKLTLYPVQYDLESGEYLIHDRLEANIRYTDAEPVNPAILPHRRNRSPEFLKMIRALAVNGDEVGRDDPDVAPDHNGHYLVVTHSGNLIWHQPFIEWRRKAGYRMDILSLSANDAGNTGTVKNRIQERYDDLIDAGEDPFDHILLIGDRQTYDNIGPGPQNVLQAESGNTIWGGAPHADYRYALLEGDDNLPDVAFSRFPSGNQNTAALVVGRTLAYEANPRMQNPEWFNRAAVYSQHWGNNEQSAWHVTIHTNVRWAEELMQHAGFTDVGFYERYEWDQVGQNIGPVVRDWLNEGRSLLSGRAENYYWRSNFNGVNNNTVFPINICMSGHGEWTAWNMFRTGDANNLKGPVLATFGWGGPPTASSSYLWLSTTNGVVSHDMTVGWAKNYALISLEQYFQNVNTPTGGVPIYLHTKTDFDIHGDPAIQPWIGVPRVLAVACPDTVDAISSVIEVHVTDPRDDVDVAGATVSLYAPGSIPLNDAGQYAAYDDMIIKTAKTDEDGIARFVMGDNETFTNNTLVYLTVTGRDIKPVFKQARVAVRGAAMELVAWALSEHEGNGDDAPNPGESFDLSLRAKNVGNRAALNGVRAVVSSVSPWVTVEENEISFGNLNSGAEGDGDDPVRIHLHRSSPDGESRPATQPELVVDFTSGNRSWRSALKLTPVAPHFKVRRLYPGEVIQARVTTVDPDLDNIGARGGAAMTGRLFSKGLGVTVIRDQANYNAIAAGGHARISGDAFTVTGNQMAIPGSRTPLLLVLTSETGFVDSVEFTVQVGSTRERAPFGPDKYGYICFDDLDDEWDISPDYEWIEINPAMNNADYEGTRVNFEGRSPFDVGECRVLPLGFETQFYGEVFDRISISTNGFISMGNQPRVTNFQNWPMNEAIGGGVGMIAPLWDDLRLDQNSGVFYYYDEENSRYIVQWHRMRPATGNADLTFQVILYDRLVWVTETGDQNILFQYKTASALENIRQGDQAWITNIPYASVGISSPDGNSGLSYCYRNTYPTAAAAIQNQRAILFSTSPRFRSGILKGNVTDAETGRPIEGVTVFTQHGFVALTDAEGDWRINGALAEVDFFITARIPGYNDSTLTDVRLTEDDSLEIDFSLLHPEFTPSVRELEAGLQPEDATDLHFNLHNGGNGPLIWRAEKRLPGDANAAPWELRRTLPVARIVEDDRIEGVVFINDEFYIAGANGADPSQIYVLNREGEIERSFDQAGIARYGFKDLEWDGEWIWGSGEDTVYAFTPDGELTTHWRGPFNPTNCIAYDPENEILWLSGTTTNIIGCDRDGNVVRQARNRLGLRLYGLAWWPDDPDGYHLYISNTQVQGMMSVHKMDVATGDTLPVYSSAVSPVNGNYTATAITNTYDVYSWVLMTVVNAAPDSGGDRLEIFQLDARKDWFELDHWSGVLQSGSDQQFTLTLDASDLPPVPFEGELVFFHNADGLQTIIPVTLEVQEGPGNWDDRTLIFQPGWNLVSLNVIPPVNDVPNLVEPLVQAGVLGIVKDGAGRFYRPANQFNNLPGWDVTNGYAFYVTQAAELRVEGEVIAPDLPIQLQQGWNLKGYCPRLPLEATAAVSSIRDQLTMLKDGAGNFYLPEFNYSNMEPLREGRGYYFQMREAAELVYGAGEERAGANSRRIDPPTHFAFDSPKGAANQSLLVIGGAEYAGWEAGVIVSSMVVGSSRFDEFGRCGIAVWGDDPTTESIEGVEVGAELSLLIWDGAVEGPTTVEVLRGEMRFTVDGLTVARLNAVAPVEFGLAGAYPNPFNGRITLSVGLPEGGEVKLAVYDLAGRNVATLMSGQATPGMHRLNWDASGLPTGLYVARLEAAGRTSLRKLTLLK